MAAHRLLLPSIKMTPLIIFLLLTCMDLSADEMALDLPFSSGETLHYKLSYRGLLTSMIWADLADVKMTFLANTRTHEQHKGHQFVLQLSTENYTKAELIQPVRYSYITTLDASLQRTLLIEEIDNGANQSHDFLWVDWPNKKTQLFKKREKELVSAGFLGLDRKEIWEGDGELAVPDFFNDFPLLENNQTYLIHKESGDKIRRSQVLDPLSLIYTLRTLDFSSDSESAKEIAIAVSDDIRLYRIELNGQEKLNVAGKYYQATRFKIHTDVKKEYSYYIWLNNDKKKTPLRLSLEAPLGKLEIDMIKITQQAGEQKESGNGNSRISQNIKEKG